METMNLDPLIAHEVQPTKTVQQLVLADERLKKIFRHHDSVAHHSRYRRQSYQARRKPAFL